MVEAVGESSKTFRVYYFHTLKNISNKSLANVKIYIPVPPNNNYQEIIRFKIDLDGQDFQMSDRIDQFGNKIKRILIPTFDKAHEITVSFSCDVRLLIPKKITMDSQNAGSINEIPQELRTIYLCDDKIFDLQNKIIRRNADWFMSNYPNPIDRAIAIHDFIAGTFQYNHDDGWDSAPEVLNRRSGSCSEFSYVFSALCRATYIPTRFIGGSTCPINSKLPFTDHNWHRWVEVYPKVA